MSCIENGHVVLLLSTSGSTGNSKVVRLSYENIYTNTVSICEYMKLNQKRDRRRQELSIASEHLWNMAVQWKQARKLTAKLYFIHRPEKNAVGKKKIVKKTLQNIKSKCIKLQLFTSSFI